MWRGGAWELNADHLIYSQATREPHWHISSLVLFTNFFFLLSATPTETFFFFPPSQTICFHFLCKKKTINNKTQCSPNSTGRDRGYVAQQDAPCVILTGLVTMCSLWEWCLKSARYCNNTVYISLQPKYQHLSIIWLQKWVLHAYNMVLREGFIGIKWKQIDTLCYFGSQYWK